MAEFVIREGVDTKGVNAKLVDIIKQAAEYAPSGISKVEIISGLAGRKSGTDNHPTGRAIDVQLYDVNGKPLYNEPINAKNDKAATIRDFSAYQGFANVAKRIQTTTYPELDGLFAWGGYMGKPPNVADTMHFDVSGARGSLGNFWDGLTATGLKVLDGVQGQTTLKSVPPVPVLMAESKARQVADAVPTGVSDYVKSWFAPGTADKVPEHTVVAKYEAASGRLVPTDNAPAPTRLALGYTSEDHPKSNAPGAAAAIEILTPTGTEGVRERTVSPTSVASASDLDWNDAALQRTNMGAPAQPAYNPLSSARTAQPAAPAVTPTPTPATPLPHPVETPQTATVSPTSVPSTTYPEPIRQPGFVSPQEVAASTIPQPSDAVEDRLTRGSLDAPPPAPVPGTGPVEPPVTKQPNAPVTGSARKVAPAAAAPPPIRKPAQPVKAAVPNARPIHPDVQPFVLRSITGISGPGPFSKATVQHYLSQQNWHAPSFDPKAGGSLYPYFTDTRSGIGGYVTPSGKAFTYSLRQNPGQSSTGATGDELRAQAYSAAHP